MKKAKVGIVFMLIGIGLPSVSAFFQEDGQLFKIKARKTAAEIKATEALMAMTKGLDEFISETTQREKETKNNPTVSNDLSSLDKYLVDDRAARLAEKVFAYKVSISEFNQFLRSTGEMGFRLPYKYAVGIGLMIFLVGLGMIIFAVMDRKGRTA